MRRRFLILLFASLLAFVFVLINLNPPRESRAMQFGATATSTRRVRLTPTPTLTPTAGILVKPTRTTTTTPTKTSTIPANTSTPTATRTTASRGLLITATPTTTKTLTAIPSSPALLASTQTATKTATKTTTPEFTNTETATSTETATNTVTPTHVATLTPSPTATTTITATPQASPTFTPTAKNTPSVDKKEKNFSFFTDNIVPPNLFNFDQGALIVNFLLALILALAFGFFSNLLNNVFESNEEEIIRTFRPVFWMWNTLRQLGGRLARGFKRSSTFGFILNLIFILLLVGFILAFLDPSFDYKDPDAFLLVVVLAFSSAFMSLADDLALYIYLRLRGGSADLKLHNGNLLMTILTTLFSRYTHITPGLLMGSPAGLENVEDSSPEWRTDLIALSATGIIAMLAWFIAPNFENNDFLYALLLIIFASGIQNIFFEMIPLGYLRGRSIFHANLFLWAALLAGAAFMFLHTMLNPDGAFISAFILPNMVTLSAVVAAFCLFSAAMWARFRK